MPSPTAAAVGDGSCGSVVDRELAGGGAHHQGARQGELSQMGCIALQQRTQLGSGDPSGFLERLADGGQAERFGQGAVVEAGHRQIGRSFQSGATHGSQ